MIEDMPVQFRFISFEPLLDMVVIPDFALDEIKWVIIGYKTPHRPRSEQLKDWDSHTMRLISQLDPTNIPLFIKDNVDWSITIQEVPEGHK